MTRKLVENRPFVNQGVISDDTILFITRDDWEPGEVSQAWVVVFPRDDSFPGRKNQAKYITDDIHHAEELASRKEGAWGSPGTAYPCNLICAKDEAWSFFEPFEAVTGLVTEEDVKQARIRRKALGKLSPEEREALGF